MVRRLRRRLLALLCAVPPLVLAPNAVLAGSFDPDLASMGAKFTKRVKENREGEILVRFKASVPTTTRDARHGLHGNLKLRELRRSGVHHVRISPAQTVEEALARYRADNSVEYAEPNYALKAMLVPNETTGFDLLWGMLNSGQTLGTPGADIKATLAWDFVTGSAGVAVMVIDSGVDTTHPDLARNVWVNPGEIPGNGIDDDGNGYIDDINGIDVVNADSNPSDDFGHGTHVAGTIGAVGNNAVGVVGVNWNVKIIPCKILDSTGNGSVADAVTCLEYARDLKARGVSIVATNNSYGGLGAFSQTMFDAIRAQPDILFIAAAGNFGLDNDTQPFYPAGFDLPNVLSVAATDHNDAMPGFSSFGRRSVHIGAPGANIMSTTPSNSYAAANGTSMASPYVAGLAALLKAQDGTRDWRAIKNLILSGGDPKPSLAGKTISGARLDAFNAVNCNQRPLFAVVKLPAAFTVGVPSTLTVLSVNCGNAVGPVTATPSSGQSFALLDDGVAPDLAAGDGIFTATWTPTQTFASINFSSAAGTEQVGALDLTISAVSGPASANRGDVVALSATVVNLSSSDAPASTVNYYLSADGIITTTDTLLASIPTAALAGGAQQVLSANATIPATLAVGTYFIGAVVDPSNLLDEGSETNNALAGSAIAISNLSVDLTATAVLGPATAFTGDPVAWSATVNNLGTTAAPASTLYLFLASNPTLSSTYVLVGAPTVGTLAGGASQVVSGSFPIPVTLPPGTYTLVAQADGPNTIIEANEVNNTGVGKPITTTTRNVDLTITSTSGPGSAKDGQSISLSANLKNQGTATAPASTVRWYLSTDNLITTADTPLASVSTASLSAGSSRVVSTTSTVPGTVAAGTYYIGAIADPDNLVPETNKTNNARASGNTTMVSYTADLVMTAVGGPTSVATGQSVTFTGTLKNQGAAAISSSVTVGFYLSNGATITTNDNLVATASVASIGAGASVPLSMTVALPTALTAGTYTIGAIADPDKLRPETNEGNNTRAGNVITVSYGLDLVMTAVAAPTSLMRGQAVTVTGTLVNQGVGAFGALSDLARLPSGTIRVGFYLSTNSNITANDRRIGAVMLTSIPAGTSIPLSVSATIPTDLAPGSYHIGAIADDTGALRESIESNNSRPGNIVNVN